VATWSTAASNADQVANLMAAQRHANSAFCCQEEDEKEKERKQKEQEQEDFS